VTALLALGDCDAAAIAGELTAGVLDLVAHAVLTQYHVTYVPSRQGKPGKGESYVADRNLSVKSRGFDSLPVAANHQPEASLACGCGNAPLEA
jgi:hypothetical protein